jgi:hypothetical protein
MLPKGYQQHKGKAIETGVMASREECIRGAK